MHIGAKFGYLYPSCRVRQAMDNWFPNFIKKVHKCKVLQGTVTDAVGYCF